MSDQSNDGGPAFPTQNGCSYDSGMTLRDWFAGMALSSMDYGWFGSSTRIQEMAEESYNIADAMISARKAVPMSHMTSQPAKKMEAAQ